jgi:hypothetical protein
VNIAKQLIAEAVKLEHEATKLRRAASVLGESTPGMKRVRVSKGRPKGTTRVGHSKNVCGYRNCGRSYIGMKGQKFCSYKCGAAERALVYAERRKLIKKGLIVPAKPKPAVLVRGDNLSH